MRPENIHRLTVLAQVADAGGLSAAARRLGVVKSSISHHVAELERELGAKVLHRSGRSVTLTPIGELLAEHGRAIAKEAAHAATVAKAAEEPRGTIRVSMPSGIADAPLIPMLAAFLDRYPGISLDVIATDTIVDLKADRIDVAFRIGGVSDGPFIARRLQTDHNVFVAAPSYLRNAPPIAGPADLSSHPLIGHVAFGTRQTFHLEGLDGNSFEVEMACRVTTTSSLAIKHWAIFGAGIARYPLGVVQAETEEGRLVNVLPDFTNRHPSLSLVYLPERFRPANVRRLIDHALSYYRGSWASDD